MDEEMRLLFVNKFPQTAPNVNHVSFLYAVWPELGWRPGPIPDLLVIMPFGEDLHTSISY